MSTFNCCTIFDIRIELNYYVCFILNCFDISKWNLAKKKSDTSISDRFLTINDRFLDAENRLMMSANTIIDPKNSVSERSSATGVTSFSDRWRHHPTISDQAFSDRGFCDRSWSLKGISDRRQAFSDPFARSLMPVFAVVTTHTLDSTIMMFYIWSNVCMSWFWSWIIE